jgi:hypothetical protein
MSSTLHHKDNPEAAWHHSQGPRVFLPVPTSRKNSETWGTPGDLPSRHFLVREIADAGGLSDCPTIHRRHFLTLPAAAQTLPPRSSSPHTPSRGRSWE